MTLIELLLAMSLMSILMLAAFSFEFAGQRFLTSSERKTSVLNSLTFAMEHMQKTYLLQHGNFMDSGQVVASWGAGPTAALVVNLRHDDPANPTPAVYNDDVVTFYRWSAVTNVLQFCPDMVMPIGAACDNSGGPPADACCAVGLQGVSTQITEFSWICPGVNGALVGPVQVGLRGRFDPAKGVDSSTNPVVTVNSTFYAPGVSM